MLCHAGALAGCVLPQQCQGMEIWGLHYLSPSSLTLALRSNPTRVIPLRLQSPVRQAIYKGNVRSSFV